MPLLGFSIFREKILDGSKTQTIRKLRKFLIRKGSTLYLYWHTRQKDCEKLKEVLCKDVFYITISYQRVGYAIRNWGTDKEFNNQCYVMEDEEEKELYTRDGFENLKDFLNFFRRYLPAKEREGTIYLQVIRW